MSNTAYKEYISKLETLYDTVVKSSADGYYEGERNSEGQPHGFGTMQYPKNDKNKRVKYTGEWVKGKIHGKGKLLWSNGDIYEGDWDGELINGIGKFVGTYGSTYEGEWKNGKKHGKGEQKWKNGDTYEGEWAGDIINGIGKFVGIVGSTYEGEWKNGKKHGKGIVIDKDGLSYEGEWREDKLINSTEKQYAGYPAVKIGKQIWMTKNLDVETFRNGDPIPHITSDEEWEEYGNQGKPAWCYYDNRKANGEKYGKLYNWYAVNDPRGLAPKGWKVPSDDEWTQLTDYLGGEDVAGKKMKSTSGWDDYEGKSGNGNNESGFSGLPGGSRVGIGSFNTIGSDGYWWSSTLYSTSEYLFARDRLLGYYYGNVRRDYSNRASGFSVRCLRD